MNVLPTKHALLRDRTHWDVASLSGLTADSDGALQLMPVPKPDTPVALPGPYGVAPSGLACATCASLFMCDTAHSQLIYRDGPCDTETRMPPQPDAGAGLGQFNAPRGLALQVGGPLYVADSGNARIVILRLPTLEPVGLITAGLSGPTALALDSKQRLTVVDGAAGHIVRFLASGDPDVTFNATIGALAVRGAYIAIDENDRLYVATQTGALWVFTSDANEVTLPALDPQLKAGALIVAESQLIVADTVTGNVCILDATSGAALARVPDFSGPVSALALCAPSDLYIKTGDDDALVHCSLPGSWCPGGSVSAGPLDAGEQDTWFLAALEAVTPPDTAAALSLYVGDDPSTPPAPADWVDIPSPAARIDNFFPHSGRYLWIAARLSQNKAQATPRLLQIRAETAGDDYLDHLPQIYAIGDSASGTFSHLLSLLRAQFDASERRIDGLPLRLAVEFAPPRDLPWLASWLAFELPAGLSADEQRALLSRVIELYDRRGTPAGIAEFVHVYTGTRPVIIEAFTERRVWQLGVVSALGFDTGLAPENPVGAVVPDPQLLQHSQPAFDCAVPSRLTVGSAVVGASGPLPNDQIGAPLFNDAAHRFRVVVGASQANDAGLREEIRRVIDTEKPAHTSYALCFIGPTMRVGVQALVGIDTIVADTPAAVALSGITLDVDSYLAQSGTAGRVGSQSRLGMSTLLA